MDSLDITRTQASHQNVLGGTDWLDDSKWPTVNMMQCRQALEISKENTIRAAMGFKFNALLSRGITLEGTPHLESMPEGTRREFNYVMGLFGLRALECMTRYGIIFWCYMDHPTFTRIPFHLDPYTTEIKFLRYTGGRVIYHLYEMYPHTHHLVSAKPRRIENAFVYEVNPPDLSGNIDSVIMSLVPYFNEFQRVRANAQLAQDQLARPQRIEEHAPQTVNDASISSSSDRVSLHNEIKQAMGLGSGSGSSDPDNLKLPTTTTSMTTLTTTTTTTQSGTIDPVSALYVQALNMMTPDQQRLLQDTTAMQRSKERRLLRDNAVELDPGKILVSNKMMKAEAPANVQEVEIAYSQRVYESLGIPRTMATSEGSKTSTNQNSQELFDNTRLECINRLEHFITEVYTKMFDRDNKYSYYINKINQYHDMKAVAQHIHKSRSRSRSRSLKRKRPQEGNEDDDDEDAAWNDKMNEAFDAVFARTCTQQEVYRCTNVKVLVTGAKPIADITAWRAAGYLNGKGARELFLHTTRIPDEYVNDEATIDKFTKAGLDTEDEGANSIAEKTEKAKAKKAATTGT